jgi:hypothetical protein
MRTNEKRLRFPSLARGYFNHEQFNSEYFGIKLFKLEPYRRPPTTFAPSTDWSLPWTELVEVSDQ